MRKLLALFFLLTSIAAAQGVRFSATVTQQGTIGAATNAVILPASPQIAFCNHPANATPCTNKATTYTDQTLATPCGGATQIVRDGTNTCVASPDAQNNWGVWVAPNTAGYDYTITLTGGVNLGPFNVLSQTTTITGAVNINSPGSLTVSGTATLTGTLNCKNFENIACVDSANSQSWSGTDVGGWLNSAYAALPANGGEIYLAAGSYSYSTAISFSTSGKVVKLHGAGRFSTTLTWTPLTGTALTLDTSGTTGQYSTLEDFTLTTSGASTATGLSTGPVNNLKWASINRVNIYNFQTSILEAGLLDTYTNVEAACNNLASSSALKAGATADSPKFYGGSLSGCSLLINNASPSNGPLSFFGTQFNGPSANGTAYVATTNEVDLFNIHFTQAAGFAAATYWALSTSFAQLKVFGGTIEDDRISGSASGGTCSAGNILMSGVTLLSGFATGANFNTLSGSCTAQFHDNNVSSANYTGLWNNAYTGGQVDECGTRGLSSPVPCMIPYAVQFQQSFTNPSGATATYYNQSGIGPTISGNAFQIRTGGSPTDQFDISSGGTTTIQGPLSINNSVVPVSAGAKDVGSASLPFGNLWLGTAGTNNFKFQPAATAAARTITIADPLQATVALPMTIANGTQALNTASITTATCDAGVAATATGTLSTDKVSWSFNAAPTATNKYGAFLVVYAVPSANTVTFYTCNPSATTSTPTAMSVNWSVERP